MKYIKTYESVSDPELNYLKDIHSYVRKKKEYELLKGFIKYKKNSSIFFKIRKGKNIKFIKNLFILTADGIFTGTNRELELDRNVYLSSYIYSFRVLDVEDFKDAIEKFKSIKDWNFLNKEKLEANSDLTDTKSAKKYVKKSPLFKMGPEARRLKIKFSTKYTGKNIGNLIQFLKDNELYILLYKNTWPVDDQMKKDMNKKEFLEYMDALARRHPTKILPILKRFYDKETIFKRWKLYTTMDDFGIFD